MIAAGLACAGVLIVLSGWREASARGRGALGLKGATWIGAIQGLCLPFRGFSRSGATISVGLLLGLDKTAVEDFSFALAVVLTPAVIAREGYRLLKAHEAAITYGDNLLQLAWPSLVGMVLELPGRVGSLALALPLAGAQPVALVWLLLPVRGRRRARAGDAVRRSAWRPRPGGEGLAPTQRLPWSTCRVAMLAGAVMLAGCAVQPLRPTAGPGGSPAQSPDDFYRQAARAGSAVFAIDPADSLLVIEVRRGGSLAKLGHDHAIASHNVRGYVAPERWPRRLFYPPR